jgi:hypothetical protein
MKSLRKSRRAICFALCGAGVLLALWLRSYYFYDALYTRWLGVSFTLASYDGGVSLLIERGGTENIPFQILSSAFASSPTNAPGRLHSLLFPKHFGFRLETRSGNWLCMDSLLVILLDDGNIHGLEFPEILVVT